MNNNGVDKPAAILSLSGLLGVCLVAVVQLSTAGVLNRRLVAASFCFALAVPVLASCLLAVRTGIRSPRMFKVLFLIGELVAVGGLAGIFFHLHVLVGIVFAVAAVVMLALTHVIQDRNVG